MAAETQPLSQAITQMDDQQQCLVIPRTDLARQNVSSNGGSASCNSSALGTPPMNWEVLRAGHGAHWAGHANELPLKVVDACSATPKIASHPIRLGTGH